MPAPLIREFDFGCRGIRVHAYAGGRGYPLLLLHGSGPGAGTASMWSKVLAPLARRYRVLAIDLIGFGRSGQKPRPPYFDVELWTRQAQAALDRLSGRGPVGVIGHSLSGYLALRLACRNPKIDKVMTTGAMGARFRANAAIKLAWSMPKSEADLRRLYRQVSMLPASATDPFVPDRFRIVSAPGYRDYFAAMFAGDKQRYIDRATLKPAELERIRARVLMLHGANDRPVPYAQAAVPLADAIPQADLVRLANCGHTPALDQAAKFLAYARGFFG
jgi:2-hydroxymuconate-semialdehyde hydrolase